MTSSLQYLSPIAMLSHSSLFDPPASKIPLPQFQNYQPTGFGQADTGVLGGTAGLSQYNTYGQYLPQAQQITQNLVNNPYASAYQTGAGIAGQLGQQGALNAYGMGGSIANTAFDPQNALYNRTIQQLQDQTRAGEGARGIANTPYGAGLENQALNNFNIDWQNNQLQRQIQGAQAAAPLQAGAAGQYANASGIPYSTSQTIGGNQFGALSNLGGFGSNAAQIPQQQIQDYQNYLGWGTQAQNAANQSQQNMFSDALNRDKQAFGQQSDVMSGIGKTAATLAPYALAMFSDARVKDDIVPIGKLNDGQNVYSYRYKGDPVPRIGLIAQDVEHFRPDAVHEIGGIKAVDYGKATEFSRGLAALSKWD